MARRAAGFSLVEVLMGMVILAVGLGGLGCLLVATLRAEGRVRARMAARLETLAALEGSPSRAAWPEGAGTAEGRFQRWNLDARP